MQRTVDRKRRLTEAELASLERRVGAVRTMKGLVGGVRLCGLTIDSGSGAYIQSFSLYLFKNGYWHRLRHQPHDRRYAAYQLHFDGRGCFLDGYGASSQRLTRLFHLTELEIQIAFDRQS